MSATTEFLQHLAGLTGIGRFSKHLIANDDDINEDNYSTMMDLSGDDGDITADSLEDYADE